LEEVAPRPTFFFPSFFSFSSSIDSSCKNCSPNAAADRLPRGRGHTGDDGAPAAAGDGSRRGCLGERSCCSHGLVCLRHFFFSGTERSDGNFHKRSEGFPNQSFLPLSRLRSDARMLSSAPLRPARPASSITSSPKNIRSGVIRGSVSLSGKRAAGNKRVPIALATPKTSTSSTSSSRSVVAAAALKTSTSSTSSSRRSVVAAAAPKKTAAKRSRKEQQIPVDYGRDWFAATRDPSRGLSPRQEMQMRREANRAANNGLERKDLYTDAWAGSEYRGSSNNIVRGSDFVGARARRFRRGEEERKKKTDTSLETPQTGKK